MEGNELFVGDHVLWAYAVDEVFRIIDFVDATGNFMIQSNLRTFEAAPSDLTFIRRDS